MLFAVEDTTLAPFTFHLIEFVFLEDVLVNVIVSPTFTNVLDAIKLASGFVNSGHCIVVVAAVPALPKESNGTTSKSTEASLLRRSNVFKKILGTFVIP